MALRDVLNTQAKKTNGSVVRVNYEEIKKELEQTNGVGNSW